MDQTKADKHPEYVRASYSVKEASKVTGLGRNAIYTAINSGELRAKKHGQRTLIIDADLRGWLETLPDYQPGGHHYATA